MSQWPKFARGDIVYPSFKRVFHPCAYFIKEIRELGGEMKWQTQQQINMAMSDQAYDLLKFNLIPKATSFDQFNMLSESG